MFKLLIAILFIGLGSHVTFAQRVTPAGDPYFCAPPGTCNAEGGGGNIDPRIVTPNQPTTCPAGTVPCYTQGLTSTCGQRFIPSTNNNPGPAPYGAYPWQAYFTNITNGLQTFAGSGVLLSPYHVLTVAHKVEAYAASPLTSGLTVYMGVYDPRTLAANTSSSTVSRIDLHPNWPTTRTTLRDDIAILVLTNPIQFPGRTNINTICLPANGQNYVSGQQCMVSGWGQQQANINDAPTNPMKQVTVPLVDYQTCRNGFNGIVTNIDQYLDPVGEICAGGQANADACFQDGGSPLVCLNSNGRYYLAGLVTWGKGCGRAGVYGVYVNVPNYINSFIIPHLATP